MRTGKSDISGWLVRLAVRLLWAGLLGVPQPSARAVVLSLAVAWAVRAYCRRRGGLPGPLRFVEVCAGLVLPVGWPPSRPVPRLRGVVALCVWSLTVVAAPRAEAGARTLGSGSDPAF